MSGAAGARPARRRRPAGRIGLNLTAMIDVVFLLLIYFMAATEFKVGEEIYRVDVPRRGRAADPFALPRDPLRIVVTSTTAAPGGVPALEVIGAGVDARPAGFDALHELLARCRRAAGTGGLLEPDHPILIEPAGAARWDHALEAFNAAAKARYANVTFAPPR